jgi:Glutathione S-transferase, C-terminal domain
MSLSLPFPYGFILPTRLRAYAVRRCAEIGTMEDLEEDDKPTLRDGISDSWLTRRRTWDDKARALRVFAPHLPIWLTLQLHALASDFYTQFSNSLQSTTEERPFLLGSRSPTSIDALVYGHLSLHLFPNLPDPVLRNTLTESHPQLASYIRKCHAFFGERNSSTVRSIEKHGWTRFLEGWGVEKGKRFEDLIGIGGLIGGILGYALWKMARRL